MSNDEWIASLTRAEQIATALSPGHGSAKVEAVALLMVAYGVAQSGSSCSTSNAAFAQLARAVADGLEPGGTPSPATRAIFDSDPELDDA